MTSRMNGAGVRVVLIGTGRHLAGSRLPPVPAVPETIRALREVFVESCRVRPGNVTEVVDPPRPESLLDAVIAAADEATDVLIVYYVGHGVQSASSELHLATQATVDLTKKAAYQALPFSELHQVLAHCAARVVILVLDCCFSGRADNPVPSGALLASADRDGQALAVTGEPHTAFSGSLITALRDGIPTAPRDLRLHHVFDHVQRDMRRRGRPTPVLRIGNNADDLVLAGNAAYQPVEDGPPDEPPDPGSCPYRGLEPYTVEDEAVFAGRTGLVSNVLRQLRQSLSTGGLVFVGGPSGCGKTSLIHAGVVPAIRRGELGALAATGSRQVFLTPGDDPLASLAAALTPIAGVDELRAAPERARDLIVAAGEQVLIVVDQFEELFAPVVSDADRRAFIAALHIASTRRGDQPPVAAVLLSVRSDFDGHCARFPELAAALEERTVVVGPMTTGDLRSAITQPAERTGYALQGGLVEILLRDAGADPVLEDAAGYQPGVLPLLSHALLATWQRRSGRTLTVEGYRAIGGVPGAVAATAEQVYGSLTTAVQEAARSLLLQMVRIGDDVPDTRRRIRRSAVAGEDARTALSAFADARLITLGGDTAELSHEALIRSWPRLTGWINADREGRRTAQELDEAAAEWQRSARDAGLLYRGARLVTATGQTQALASGDLSPAA
ncbi:MAG: caspase family protein, partial [Actinoplanes sp.]